MASNLSLPAELTIYTVGELHPQWLTWLTARVGADVPTDVVVEGSAVDQVDAAGVQLLMALSRSLMQAGRSLCLVDASPVLTHACEALGFPVPSGHAVAQGGAR